jgi:hypothetical protein
MDEKEMTRKLNKFVRLGNELNEEMKRLHGAAAGLIHGQERKVFLSAAFHADPIEADVPAYWDARMCKGNCKCSKPVVPQLAPAKAERKPTSQTKAGFEI